MCMKKLYLLSILFIVSCASSPEQLQAKASKQSDIDLCFDLTYEPSQYVRQELANRRVDCNLPSLKARVAEKRQKQVAMGQALMAFGSALQDANNPSYTQPTTIEPVTLQRRYQLKRQYVEGTSKVCVYDGGGKIHVVTHPNQYTPCKPAVSVSL